MATTYFDVSAHPRGTTNPLGIKGIDHVEFIVDDADQWRDFFLGRFGMAPRFIADESTGVKGRRAHVVGQGRINFVLVEPQGHGPEADLLRWHLDRHGNGVRDVAFRVRDARHALDEAARRDARAIPTPDAFPSCSTGK